MRDSGLSAWLASPGLPPGKSPHALVPLALALSTLLRPGTPSLPLSGNSQALKSCVCENGSQPTVSSSSCSCWLHDPHRFTHEGTNTSARFHRGELGVRPCFPCSSPGSGPGCRAGGARLSCALTTARARGAHAGLLQKTLQPLSRQWQDHPLGTWPA